VKRKTPKDLDGSFGKMSVIYGVEDQDQNLSKSKAKAGVKTRFQSSTAQDNAASKFNHNSGGKDQNEISDSDKETAQYYSNILRLRNKQKLASNGRQAPHS
jgi:hypothetical protein